jgi:hypothetical protein
MDIRNIRPDPAAARPPAPVTPVREETKQPEAAVDHDSGRENGDSVEISEEARSRAAAQNGSADVPSGTMPADRLIELRRRIQERVQDTPEMADEVMRRIADRGDLV